LRLERSGGAARRRKRAHVMCLRFDVGDEDE
jgi:hypothetical protein